MHKIKIMMAFTCLFILGCGRTEPSVRLEDSFSIRVIIGPYESDSGMKVVRVVFANDQTPLNQASSGDTWIIVKEFEAFPIEAIPQHLIGINLGQKKFKIVYHILNSEKLPLVFIREFSEVQAEAPVAKAP